MASGATSEIWHDNGRAYRLVDAQVSAYPRSEWRKIDGRKVLVKLPDLVVHHVRAVLVGNEHLGEENASTRNES